MSILQVIILILALLMLTKGILMLFFPAASRRLLDWWLQSPPGLLRAAGIAAILVGMGMIGSAVVKMGDPVIATVTIAGTLFVIAGMLYQWPPAVQTLSKPLRAENGIWANRFAGVLALAIAIVFLIILYWSRSGG